MPGLSAAANTCITMLGTNLFWNQIWTDLSVMLISCAIRSRTVAVGVGFLMNSSSSVRSWSCVALCRFWFFCCWVRVLLRGGRRDVGATGAPGVLALAETVGEVVEDDIFIKRSQAVITQL